MKRKCGKCPTYSSLMPNPSSDNGEESVRDRKKCREEPRSSSVPADHCRKPSLPSDFSLRGLKRKLGCIEACTRIGRKKKLENEFILRSEIGQGKFGSVRLCIHRATGKEFACKTLPKNGEETVHREVEIMQHLSGHPGVVTLMKVYDDSDSVHLIMELCSGGHLLNRIAREGKLSEHKAAELLKELMLVIKYCHDMGVVHRDVKPENILLTASGKMKLADFGLAVRVTNGLKLCGVVGSPAYVAPEVLSGPYSEEVDIWGAGVLLHLLLAGFLPFQGDSLDSVFQAIKTFDLNFSSGPWGALSELGRDLIGRMLRRDVATRITADEVLRHPWITFHTETQTRGPSPSLESDSKQFPADSSDGEEDHDLVDVLAIALSRVAISEPKRSRLYVPAAAVSVQQEYSSNLKPNLCKAF